MSGDGQGPAPLLACLLFACLGTAVATDCKGAGSGGCAGAALGSVTTLYQRIRSWGDYAEPLAVLQLGRPVAAAHFVPRWREGAPPRFLAVGDAAGGLHLLTPGGRLVAQHHTGMSAQRTNSSITALASYRLGRNATVLLTGHASGELRLHALQQQQQQQEQAAAGGAGGGAIRGGRGWEGEQEEEGAEMAVELSLMDAFPPESLLCSLPPAPASCSAESQAQQQGQPEGGQRATCAVAPGAAQRGGCAPILQLQTLSRGGTAAATAAIVDGMGRLAVLKHGGPQGAAARIVRLAALAQAPLAVQLSGAAAAVLGEYGVSSQRLSLPPAAKGGGSAQQQQQQPDVAGEQAHIIAAAADAGTAAAAVEAVTAGAAAAAGSASASPPFKPCRNLNGSRLVAAAFDAQFVSRAYALTDDGWLLALVVGSERAPAASGCTVKARTALPGGLLLPPPQLQHQQQQEQQQAGDGSGAAHLAGSLPAAASLAALPGYLVVTAGDSLAVFNTTLAPRRAPRLLLLQPLAPLRQQFGIAAAAPGAQQAEQGRQGEPLPPPPPPVALLAAEPHGGRHLALALGPAELALYEVSLPYRAPPARGGRGSGPMAWLQLLQPVGMVLVAGVVLYRARARRGGAGGVSFSGDARLREFERLLQNPMAGATAYRRHRPAPGGGRGDDPLGGSSSEADDSEQGFVPRGGGHRSAGTSGRQAGGLLGRLTGRNGTGAGSGGSRRDLAVRSRRAAALAAADDRDIAALCAELAGGGPGDGSGSEGEGRPAGLLPQGGAGAPSAAGGMLMADGGGRVSDEVSQLRHRFGQARIS